MILNIKNVSRSYGKNLALNNFSAALTPGVYAILGPNGSGKSTLMNILTDNLRADSGEICFSDTQRVEDEENVRDLGAGFRAKIGYMPQYPGMFEDFTVDVFLRYMAVLKGTGDGKSKQEKRRIIDKAISQILHEVDLEDVRYRMIKTLSGGMKQRLGLAQAVIGDPAILILDEPTAGLDPKQRISIRNYISRIAFNKIALIATHVVSDIEYIAKEIIMLKKGVIADFAAVPELLSKIEGKVWQITCEPWEVTEYQSKFHVTNIQKEEGYVSLRIMSDTMPAEGARETAPTLEDYYLYVFDRA